MAVSARRARLRHERRGAKAVLLDKDGTLVEDVPYNVDPARVRIFPRAVEGLRLWQHAGYRLFVVTNQSGVARGLFGLEELSRLQEHIDELLSEAGVHVDGWYCCPHHPEGIVREYALECDCRKPAPGLVQQAAREHGLDLRACWMVGDILDDVEAGRRAGCQTVLLDNGHETEWRRGPLREPQVRATNLLAAAQAVLAWDRARSETGRR
jgi:D-glycero-D-manno-heptose 1,7-bisphosphate phosphatase